METITQTNKINKQMVAGGTHSSIPVRRDDRHLRGTHAAIIEPVKTHAVSAIIEAELDARISILNSISMVTITDVQGTIIYANDLFCTVTGYPRNSVIGQSHKIIRHPDLPEHTVNSIWETIRKGDSWHGTIKSRKKNGENFWTKTIVAPVMENNVPARYVWVRHDITDLKETEARLYQAKQRADQQMLDNIRDASRLQRTLLPRAEDLKQSFRSSFVMYNPKHSVGGDFYWFKKLKSETIVVLGDSTGHGISAAFVSMIALSGLKYVVDDLRASDPGAVLTELNGFIYRMMKKNEGSGLRESADMTFCRYNHVTRILSYACCLSRIYRVHNNLVEELSQHNTSVGAMSESEGPIATSHVALEPGDRIFMVSDGMADQFGGERNKRMGSRQVRELLASTSFLPIKDQEEIITKNFLHWKGSNEQTDDTTLIAFEVD
jgi:PAS domain S-box-containing protein